MPLPAASLADGFDLALRGSAEPIGELSAHRDVGPFALTLRHSEYLAYLNRDYRDSDGEENPLVRRSEIGATGNLDLGARSALPYGLGFALDEWENGERELRVTGQGGLVLGGMRAVHRLTLAARYGADGGASPNGGGRLSLTGEAFGGRHDGVVEYDVLPQRRITRLGLNSDWRLEDGGVVVAGLDHRPLDRVSEARFGFRRPLGAFEMTSNVAADSTGAYSLGLSFSLALNDTPEAPVWRLSSMLSALRTASGAPPDQAGSTFLGGD
ncbi:hypothetical protein AAFN88_14245 [Pelagibius sp. CAU 1746]|uniref:hypothetical protein n=1 Tax=Pelagibius sp. CAU 1746 TaxID=3140370 RepID=UPI00325B52ED